VIFAGFGEHGKDALQEMLPVPVLDIAEAAAHVAQLIGRRFSVVTTLVRSIPAIEDRFMLAGLTAHCASVRACGLSTAQVDADPEGAIQTIVEEAAKAVAEDGADVICLGCAGMAGVTAAITAKLGVPAVDGVAAAVGWRRRWSDSG
jgi:allantoin racemase